jgi:hypothetical protein
MRSVVFLIPVFDVHTGILQCRVGHLLDSAGVVGVVVPFGRQHI